uniref:Glycosyltransferase n=1 Tax=Leersia perrieri TaxID=77586 RepID=A0A0D9V5C3_9ORYZ
MGRTVVLYPGPGIGHLVPMVELAKVFLQHGVAVTVVLVQPPLEAFDLSSSVARFAAANPSVNFHVLPPPPPAGSGSGGDDTSARPIVRMFGLLDAMNTPLRDFLRSLPSVHALVIDMFCTTALGVASELRLPAYVFFSSAASDLAVFLHLPSTRDSIKISLGEPGDSVVHFPGVPPFKASDIPSEILHDDEASRVILSTFQDLLDSTGVLVNTFESLETRALRALKDGLCVTGRATPPVYCVGPLVSGGGGDEKDHEYLRWLDAQPDKSVVFLSFGSLGAFSKKQVEEIAIGLQSSEQRFLWVVRNPRNDEKNLAEPLAEPDLDALLPAGFTESTKGRGLVVKLWAPQVEVLRHRATGAFMTHCGWNSSLEGITAGLPLLCWPLYAEQRLNKVFLVEEMKLGVEMRGYDGELVNAEEVEAKVRWVMESEDCQALRQRAIAMKDAAVEALREGGSSHAAFVKFLEDLQSYVDSVSRPTGRGRSTACNVINLNMDVNDLDIGLDAITQAFWMIYRRGTSIVCMRRPKEGRPTYKKGLDRKRY